MARSKAERRYYGWTIVGALSLTETVSWGVLCYAFSVFIVPMRNELGWSLATLTGAYSLALLLSGLCAPLVGTWLDRHGPRLLMTAGSILGVACVLSWSRVDSVPVYYLTWAGIGVAMSATLYDPAFTTIAHWFRRYRNRAVLIVTIAAGFASTIFLPVSSLLVERFGWRDALLLLALILAICTVPFHGLVLRRRPDDLGLRIDGETEARHPASTGTVELDEHSVTLRHALRGASFWLLAIAFVLQTFSMVAVSIVLIPYLTDRGEDPAYAAMATGLIGAAQVLSRIVSTVFGEHISPVILTAGVFVLQAVALAVLIGWQVQAGILVAVLLLGAGRGVVTLMRAQLIGEFYGRMHYGAINGTLALFVTVAGALAPICAGVIYGVLNDYTPLLWAMAVISLVAAAVMAQLRFHGQPARDMVGSRAERAAG
jgi:MFS family permease